MMVIRAMEEIARLENLLGACSLLRHVLTDYLAKIVNFGDPEKLGALGLKAMTFCKFCRSASTHDSSRPCLHRFQKTRHWQ